MSGPNAGTQGDGVALLDSVWVFRDGADLVFVADPPFRVPDAPPGLERFIAALAAGLPGASVRADELTRAEASLLRALESRGLLVPRPLDRPPDQYTKQRRWLAHTGAGEEAGLLRLRRQRCLVLGCGGVGSIVAMHLGAMGAGELLLIDCDRVEPTNFNRQLPYALADVGRRKADALKAFLDARYPDTRVTAADRFVDSVAALDALVPDTFRGPDTTVLCCADQPVGTLAAVVADWTRARGSRALFAASGVHDAAIGPLLRGGPESEAYGADMRELTDRMADAVTGATLAASIAPVNTIAAAWMAYEWVAAALESEGAATAGRRIVVDLTAATVTEEARWPRRSGGG